VTHTRRRTIEETAMSHPQPVVPLPLEKLLTVRGYAPGMRVGNLLFVSGMLGRDAQLKVIAEAEAQFTQLFENFRMVLEEAGCGFADVVELTGYFTHLQRDYDLFMRVRDRYLGATRPAQTMIGVAELAMPGLLCELKGVAVLPA